MVSTKTLSQKHCCRRRVVLFLILSLRWNPLGVPEGPTIKKIRSRSKFSISIEISALARKFQSRCLDFPTKNRAAVCGSLENFILDRNVQSRSKSRIFLIFGPSGVSREKRVYTTTAGPLFSRSVARPRGHRAKKAIVYTIFLGKQRRKGYTP